MSHRPVGMGIRQEVIMKNAYPIVLTPDETGYVVYVPDFDINTEGDDLAEAMEMARDAIGIIGIDMEDDGKPLPKPTAVKDVSAEANELVTLVDVDFAEYRREHEMRAVKKNCTIPGWLCYRAEKANINFSQVLQEGLKQALHLEG